LVSKGDGSMEAVCAALALDDIVDAPDDIAILTVVGRETGAGTGSGTAGEGRLGVIQ